MTLGPEEEFNIGATRTQEQLRKLLYLARQDNDAILTDALKSSRGRPLSIDAAHRIAG